MCGRYAVFTEEENEELRGIINDINDRFKNDHAKIGNVSELNLMKTGEIFPTNIVPVITEQLGNKRTANLFKWGFPNYRQPSGVIINARCETLHEKTTFKKLLAYGRCLVPASGFYEWKAAPQHKEKYLIRPTGNELMYFAGLYNNFTDKNGLSFTSFVIITTEANSQMSQIHTRMPVILSNSEASIWMTAGNTENIGNRGCDNNTGSFGSVCSTGNSKNTGSSSNTDSSVISENAAISSILRPYSSELIFEKVG